jgi:predicted hydrocarbon binding protein
VVRVRNPGAKPPNLQTVRHGADEVVLVYTSPRQMCALAIGIGKGLAKHFKENITVTQTMCMHKGASKCEIVFQKVK